MDYLAQLKALDEHTSVENLPVNAFAVYVKMLFLNNRLHWREWFAVTYDRLCVETGINSKHTIKTVLNTLEQKGFIAVKRGKKKEANSYKIIPLYGAKFAPQTEHKGNTKGTKKGTQAEQKGNTKGTQTGCIIRPDETRQDEDQTAAAAVHEKDNESTKVFSAFSDNIHPITGIIERDRLAELVGSYGEKWVLAAIEEAALQHARSVKYVAAILDRWKREGFQTARQTPSKQAREPRGVAELRAILEEANP